MKQRHAAGRGGRGRERLQLIFGRRDDDAVDDGDGIAGEFAHQMAEHGEELIVSLQRRGNIDETQQELPGAILCEVEADRGDAAGDRAADVEKIRIAFGARTNDRIREGDGI